MKKRNPIIVLLALVMIMCAAVGCSPKHNPTEEITLSLDKTTAYFTAETELYPVSGALPLAGDPCETKTVTLSSDADVKMRLVLTTESEVPEGLMISVNGGIAKQIESGITLYESEQKEKQAELTLTVFVASGADKSAAGKSVEFSLELSYEGEQ